MWIHEARRRTLEVLLREIVGGRRDKVSVLDLGCGVGYFSQFLLQAGFDVTAIDARQANVDEAARRATGAKLLCKDIEDKEIRSLGQFDVTVCLGLLYHLENPFSAIRNLYSLTRAVAVIESMVVPGEAAACRLVQEYEGEDQALAYIALIPSETAMVSMLLQAGFSFIYRTNERTEHKDFSADHDNHRRRVFIVASHEELQSDLLDRIDDVKLPVDVWRKSGRRGLVQSIAEWGRVQLWYVARRLSLSLPSWGPRQGWIWCHGDVLGRTIWFRRPYEVYQRKLVSDYLEEGMCFYDLGANQGIYTVLASRLCGHAGCVHSFEPCSSELKKLLRNIRWNRCKNVRVHREAIGRSKGRGQLFVVLGDETGGNSLRLPGQDIAQETRKEQVEIVSLDDFVTSSGSSLPDFMKIDAEGGERDVLAGAQQVLSSKTRPIVMVEVSDMRTKPWGYQARQIVEQLEYSNYCFFEIGWKVLVPHTIRDYYEYIDLLAVPKDRLAQFARRLESRGWSIENNEGL